MRSSNSSSFIFLNIRMQNNLAERLSFSCSCSMDLNKNNIRERKKISTRHKTCQNSPINVIHDIKEESNVLSWVHDNMVNEDVLIFVQWVMLVDVHPPSCQPMISPPTHRTFCPQNEQTQSPIGKWHRRRNKPPAIMGFKRPWCRRRHEGPHRGCCMDSSVTIMMTYHELTFQTSNINIVDGPNKKKTL